MQKCKEYKQKSALFAAIRGARKKYTKNNIRHNKRKYLVNYPKSTLIISVYKDVDSLDLILESLAKQTILPNEVIISEDGNSLEMANFTSEAKEKYQNLNIIHLTQEDKGWRKNRALNRAIVEASNEYLIFIDGDCIPYMGFVEGHLHHSRKNVVLCGKRMELGPILTKKIKDKELSVFDVEKNYIKFLPKLFKDSSRHIEDGFVLNKNNIIAKVIQKRKVRHILGCNFSLYKENFLEINGLNEDFINLAEGEDVDPSWRFEEINIKLKSVRLVANIAHLYHKKIFDHETGKINRIIMNKSKQKKQYFTTNGIIKLKD